MVQVGMYKSLSSAVAGVKAQGPRPWSGFYVGYSTTVMREIPFAFIQFPIWEHLKRSWAQMQGYPIMAWQSALCGSFSGGLAAAITTPIDVAKTRLMLLQVDISESKGRGPSLFKAIRQIHSEEGAAGLFRGVGPRVMWISIGGAVFFGAYEHVYRTLRLL